MKKYVFAFFLLSVLAVNGQSYLDKDFKNRLDDIDKQWVKTKKASDTIQLKKYIEEIIEDAEAPDFRVVRTVAKRYLAVWHERNKDSLTAEKMYFGVLDTFKLFKEPLEYAKTVGYLSRFYQGFNNYRKAIDYGLQYERLSKTLKLEDKGLLLGNIADNYSRINQLDSALFWRKLAIDDLIETGDSLSGARQMTYCIYDYVLLSHGGIVCQNPKYAHETAINAQLLLDRILQITQKAKKNKKNKDVLLTIALAYHNYKCIVSIETANPMSKWYCNYDTTLFYCQLAIDAYKKTDNYILNAPSLAWDKSILFLQKAIIAADTTAILECEPWYYNAHYKIRKTDYSLGDSSIYWAKKGLEIVKNNKNTEGVLDVEKSLWHHLALTYYAMDSVDKAAFYWGLVNDTYTRGNFNNIYAWNIKKVFEEKGDYEAVITLGKKVLTIDDVGYSMLSEGYWGNKQPEEAIKCMKSFIEKSEIGFNREQNLAYAWGKLSYYYDHKRINVCACDSVVDKAINASKNALAFVQEPYNDTLFLRLTNLYYVKNIRDSSAYYFKNWIRIRSSQKRENDSLESNRLLNLDLYRKFRECFIENKYDSVIYWGERILELGESNFDTHYKEELCNTMIFVAFTIKRKDLATIYGNKIRSIFWEHRDIPKLTSYVRWAIDSNMIEKKEIELYVNNVQKDSSTWQLLAEGFEFLAKLDSAAVYYEKIFQATPLKWLQWKEGNRFKAIECYHKTKQYNKVIELSKALSDTIISTKKAMRNVWKAGELGELHLFTFSWVKNIIYSFAVLKDTNPVLYLQYYENAKYSNTDALIFTANACFESGQDTLGVFYTGYTDDRYIFNATKKRLLDSLLAFNHYKSGLFYLKKGSYDNAVHSLEASERENIEINGLNQVRLDAEYKRAWGYQTNIGYWKRVNDRLDKVGSEDPENLWRRFEAKYFLNELDNNKTEATQLLNKIKNHYNEKGFSTKHPYFFALDIFNEDFKKLQEKEEEKRREHNARLEAENLGIRLKYEKKLQDSTMTLKDIKFYNDSVRADITSKNKKEVDDLNTKLKEENFITKLISIVAIIAMLVAVISYMKARNRRKKEQTANHNLKLANEEINKQFIQLEERNQEIMFQNETLQEQRDKIEILKEEMTHRVGGNLNFFLANLNMQNRREKEENVKVVLGKSIARLNAMKEVQTIIKKLEKPQVPILLNNFIQDFAPTILKQFEYKSIELIIGSIEPIEVHYEQAIRFSQLLNEVITNACKYAFEGIDYPKIWVDLKKDKGEFYVFEIKDNGKGLPINYEERRKNSIGITIIESCIEGLKGERIFSDEKKEYGVWYKIKFIF